ncbi:hypothetical protein RRG08_053229 [Elysia crispata]|uniref:Uncharacterized protein n=1 Tax=Elysia crispata TaxID=231223 RepID=A0AAE1E286_9GAST|nr:hypothetical protein RRG08_053229 [Elysia crispata]
MRTLRWSLKVGEENERAPDDGSRGPEIGACMQQATLPRSATGRKFGSSPGLGVEKSGRGLCYSRSVLLSPARLLSPHAPDNSHTDTPDPHPLTLYRVGLPQLATLEETGRVWGPETGD